MYQTVKKILVGSFILFEIIFILFFADELIYDYRTESYFEIFAAILLIGIFTYAVILNIQTIKISVPKEEELNILDTPEYTPVKSDLKKVRTKLLVCYLVNTIIFLLLLSLCGSMLTVILERNVDPGTFRPEWVIWILVLSFTFFTLYSVILDIKVRRKMKRELK